MTLQQEAYSRIDQMTDDGIRALLDIIDKMKIVSMTGFKEPESSAAVLSASPLMTKEEKKQRFLQSVGTIQIDADAVADLRKRSMI